MQFTYSFAQDYITSLALSADGTSGIVCTVRSQGGELVSKVTVFQFDQADPVTQYESRDNLLLGGLLGENGMLYAVGDSSLLWARASDLAFSEYSYQGRSPTAFRLEGGQAYVSISAYEHAGASTLLVFRDAGDPVEIQAEARIQAPVRFRRHGGGADRPRAGALRRLHRQRAGPGGRGERCPEHRPFQREHRLCAGRQRGAADSGSLRAPKNRTKRQASQCLPFFMYRVPLPGQKVLVLPGLLQALGEGLGKALVLWGKAALGLDRAAFDAPEAGDAPAAVNGSTVLPNGPHGALVPAQAAAGAVFQGRGHKAAALAPLPVGGGSPGGEALPAGVPVVPGLQDEGPVLLQVLRCGAAHLDGAVGVLPPPGRPRQGGTNPAPGRSPSAPGGRRQSPGCRR